jgi:hypothetical protein
MSDSLQIIEIIRNAGLRPHSYSGRGMMGRACVGVALDNMNGFGAIIRAAGDCDTAADLFEGMRTDQLGYGIIAYWPDFEWIEVDQNGLEVEDDEDEEVA